MSSPWDRFRNLCRYYADCVKYSEKSQEYIFPDQLGKSFLMPALPIDWHKKSETFDIQTSPNDRFVRANLLAASDEEELFIGYPLTSFISPTGVECLCPVMLFPVSIAVRGAGYTSGMRMEIDRQGISVNQDWIEWHIPKSDQKAFQRACEQANDEFGCVDVELVLNYVARHFATDEFDPNRLSFTVRHSQSKNGLLNTAVLFIGNKTSYTKNLLSELRQIRDEPDAVLDKTALAFVFRDPPIPNDAMFEKDNAGEKRIPVSFTAHGMNAGQFNAVEEALNRPLVKVTGPPGTGKSFMSVNLIANEVLNGGSVLFTSKNHKAIHAIFDKADDAVDEKDFPLVAFCTTPDNPTNADWQKSQDAVDNRVALAQRRMAKGDGFPPGAIQAFEVARMPNSTALDVSVSSFRDAESDIRHYQSLRERISRFERLLAGIDGQLGEVHPDKRDSPEFNALLREIDDVLEERPPIGLWRRILVALQSVFTRPHHGLSDETLHRQLSEFAPSLANAIVSRRTLRLEVHRILNLLKCRQLVRAWELAEVDALRAAASERDYSTLKKVTKAALVNSTKVVHGAYVERLTERILSVDEADAVVAQCQDSVKKAFPTMPLPSMSSIDDAGKYDTAIADFRRYLDIYPAWAATMLSLRRAAPCLPAVFDLAIIDEASQCDIPPMIPVLFRAKRAAIVGDPDQFPPVITLKERRDVVFRRKYGVDAPECRRWAFGKTGAGKPNSVFSIVPVRPILLDEHFRCADGIAEYFNDEFYNGNLSLCCEIGRNAENNRDAKSAIGGLKPGIVWTDAGGGDEAEMEAALIFLKELKRRGFDGSIGVISPLRDLANRFKTKVASQRSAMPPQLDIQSGINTANGFQGGECDVILFLLGLNEDRTHGEEWYITASENKYIFNVSVSRAKRLFMSFGDRKRVEMSGLPYIRRLIPENRPSRTPKVGPGETMLHAALEHAGVAVEAQYPVAGRYLDLAIPSVKLDIEVDGQAWHLDRNGCRKADDIHRDILLESLGWHVLRFWHHEITGDVVKVIDNIKRKIAEISAKP